MFRWSHSRPRPSPQLDEDDNATYLVIGTGRSHPVVPPGGASHLEVIMSDIERRLREFAARLTEWWNSSARSARRRGTDGAADMRRGAAEHVHRAASRVQDFRQSERGQRAASKISDLRASEAAKKAEAALHDLRGTEAAKKAESALADLRQREPVKKAEESARKVMHDLFTGGSGDSDATSTK